MAIEALATVGYDPVGPIPETPAAAIERAHYGHQIRFLGRGRRPLELHFRLVNLGPPRAEETWVWDTAVSLQIGEGKIRVPGPEAMLLHLLLHVAQHGFAVLRLLYDVRFALAAIGDRLDWDVLNARITEQRCTAIAYHALRLSEELAGARLAPGAAGLRRPPALRSWLCQRLWDLEAAGRLESPRGAMELEMPKLYLLELGRMRDKLRYLLALARQAGGLVAFVRAGLAALGLSGTDRAR